MNFTPLKSPKVKPGESLLSVLKGVLKSQPLKTGDVLVIASKVISYAEGGLRQVKNDDDFRSLVRQEADQVFADADMMITLKNHVLIPNAGIDNSNTPKNEVVLWPKDAFASAYALREQLMQEYDLQELGIVVSDSHCQPLRWGTTGIAIGWAGFEGVQDERGSKDLYEKKLHYTRIAVADDLAAGANLLMGEAGNSMPFVIVRDAPVRFTSQKASMQDYAIPMDECIYSSVYRADLFKK